MVRLWRRKCFVQSLRDQSSGTFYNNITTPWIPRVGRALVGTATTLRYFSPSISRPPRDRCTGSGGGQNTALGPGKAAGVRASGPKVQPSVRRRRSHWELVQSSSDKEVLHNTRSTRRGGRV
ncbi:hypothetical protein N657DRAFT_405220 [Parathielavia appendiculata]|uniref:Uncharacterized protein n=1 Tax=Parathielavia appendiculata TaxID=2587402 RepID=A0AAN6YZA1_9PEZI|nr:hypothetical protein N657DRAFT_405220 [Parathielavia appendiculata]